MDILSARSHVMLCKDHVMQCSAIIDDGVLSCIIDRCGIDPVRDLLYDVIIMVQCGAVCDTI